MLKKTFWMDEEHAVKAYKRNYISYDEFIDTIFDSVKKHDKKLRDKELKHFALDDDFGVAWKELIVKEKRPEYFFK